MTMGHSVHDIIWEELEQLRRDIIEASRKAGQEASGDTYAAIAIENISTSGGQLTGPAYIGVLTRGRRPGKVPYDFAEIIKEWAGYKGISFGSEEEFDRWANAVAWKIRRDGTSLWQDVGSMGLEQDIFYTPIRNFIARISERLAGFYQIQIVQQIDNLWQ